MRMKIISDLHQEFGISHIDFGNADLVILAGDTKLGTKGIDWVKENIRDKPVIYILGNHEYYKGAYPKTLDQIIKASLHSKFNH
ncbi:metallophosphoesterase [Pedobacter suwonensis]|uniref:metallophosphoesterase n=2 Tax=Pedobacter suwonensis TaxID=332999 RepID=UPI003804A219